MASSDGIATFEQLVGSHGGMGGGQSFPFVLYPGSWSAPAQPIVGAEAMHRQLKRWLAEVGQSEHAERLLEPDLPFSEPAASGDRLRGRKVRSA